MCTCVRNNERTVELHKGGGLDGAVEVRLDTELGLEILVRVGERPGEVHDADLQKQKRKQKKTQAMVYIIGVEKTKSVGERKQGKPPDATAIGVELEGGRATPTQKKTKNKISDDEYDPT